MLKRPPTRIELKPEDKEEARFGSSFDSQLRSARPAPETGGAFIDSARAICSRLCIGFCLKSPPSSPLNRTARGSAQGSGRSQRHRGEPRGGTSARRSVTSAHAATPSASARTGCYRLLTFLSPVCSRSSPLLSGLALCRSRLSSECLPSSSTTLFNVCEQMTTRTPGENAPPPLITDDNGSAGTPSAYASPNKRCAQERVRRALELKTALVLRSPFDPIRGDVAFCC